MTIMPLSLDDKYDVERGRVFLTGIQALVRLPLMQKRLDRAAGLNTAGFVSGYRGSPLGGLDQQLWRAAKHLKSHDIVFQPGLNEDLAATAVWGSQQANLYPGATHDGVFGMWYGKAPGVDRTGDVFKHANAAGTFGKGGVLAVLGDDHACKSSTLPSQSEFSMLDAEIPILNPAGIQEVLDYGLYGWAMSRYSGAWVSMIALAENMDASATVDVAPDRVQIRNPHGFVLPQGGLSIRVEDTPPAQEERLRIHKKGAAIAFARENVLNRVVLDSPMARIGIVASGKSYLDLRQAFLDMGIGNREIAGMGLRVFKVGMPWPLDDEAVRRFADGLEIVIVVEEKRDFIETQFKSAVFDLPERRRPRVIGKYDLEGKPLLRQTLDLNAAQIAVALARLIPRESWTQLMERDLARIEAKTRATQAMSAIHERIPFYCAGCPHNTSTKVPDGMRALAGIGCHYMVTRMPERHTTQFTQMGGEGVPWIGAAPFTTQKHIFANLGDGTYFHSGALAIRQAVSAKANITYKLLYNDAVAMTGGQPIDGELPLDLLLRQLLAEGVSRVVLVSDDIEKYPRGAFPHEVKYRHRDEIDSLQRELAEEQGVSVIVYDQTCAAEKRRRRKRKLMADPPKRIVINEAVCEGCGDCSVQSNCIAVEPLETDFGRKRTINQSNCNKDFSCVKGFCPSFVTLEGASVRAREVPKLPDFEAIPQPERPALGSDTFNVVITGIGGTGVTSLGAILGTAAHMEGRAATVLDMMGLAQKGGGVSSFVRVADARVRIHGPRVATATADLILGCDMVVAAKPETIDAADDRRTRAVINADLSPTAAFVTNGAIDYDTAAMKKRIRENTAAMSEIPADELATRLLGDTIFSNMLLMGAAYQMGAVPVGEEAMLTAIALNGAEVKKNQLAFRYGRLAAHDLSAALKLAGLERDAKPDIAVTLDEIVARRVAHLTGYQNAALAARFAALVEKARAAEAKARPGSEAFTIALAKAYAKLLAYKDEYEVARLFTDGAFIKRVREEFQGVTKMKFHLAPPGMARTDPATGRPQKMTLGPWMMTAYRVLAKLKGLRGGAFDIFGYSKDRRLERRLIAEFEALAAELIAGLTPSNLALATRIAALPMEMKGYGYIKDANVETAKVKEKALLARFRAGEAAGQLQAAE
ncbi:MAG: indolepyruvate ferredoxin oxidoreductase family protein [Alphaproteobacteria bacterium]|nr:indolepyruvate ferredoxin oxidoreductase family protein [Alphaproteobacteria bacterium]